MKQVLKRHFIATLLGACLACPASAADDFTELALAAARQAFPGQEFGAESIVQGPLNHDGLVDFAVLTDGPTTNDGDEGPLRVAVFLGKKGGGFQAPIISGDTFRHPRVDQELEMKRGSLFLIRAIEGAGTETFQFSMRGGALVLVGEEQSYVQTQGKTAGDEMYGTSINFLTHVVISWDVIGKTRKESRKTFPPAPLIKLQDFHYLHHPRP